MLGEGNFSRKPKILIQNPKFQYKTPNFSTKPKISVQKPTFQYKTQNFSTKPKILVQNPSCKNISVPIGAGNCIVLVVLSLPAEPSGVGFPAWVCDFSLYHIVQNFSQAHPASNSLASWGSPRGVKVVKAWGWHFTLNLVPRFKMSGVLHLFYTCSTPVLRLFYACSTSVLRLFYTCSTPVLHLFYICSTPVPLARLQDPQGQIYLYHQPWL